MAKRLLLRSKSKSSNSTSDGTRTVPSGRQSGLILLASFVLFLGALFVWYRSYYTRPSVVLWGAIDRALNTPGVVKRVVRQNADGSTDVMSLARYEGDQGIQIRTALAQKTPSENGGEPVEARATAESLGINGGDFQRYTETPTSGVPEQQKIIFDQIVGKWVKTGEGGTGKPGQLFIDNMLGTIPFGNLTPSQRSEMVEFGRTGNNTLSPIFASIDYNAVKKSSKNGRPIYTYELTVRADSYAKWYQQYFAFMGFPQFADQQYTSAVQNALGVTEDTKLILEIDVLSRQIRTINRSGGDAEVAGGSPVETIYSYGIAPEFREPADSLSTEQFQEIITNATGGGAEAQQDPNAQPGTDAGGQGQ